MAVEKVGQALASVDIAEMITSLGIGIAKAQFELDQTSADIARMMSGVNPGDRVFFGGQMLSLIELGFTPTFYQFIESTIEVKVVVKMEISTSSDVTSKTKTKTTEFKSRWSWWYGGGKSQVRATTQTVDAKYSNKYDFSVEASSLVRTKLVPVPPPAILEERIHMLMDEEARVRYNEEVRRLLAIHKEDIIAAINAWDKRLSPTTSITSVGNLQAAILDANPSYKTMVSEFPDVMVHPNINAALQARFRVFLVERENIREDLVSEINRWTPDNSKVYPTANEIKSDVRLSVPSGLQVKLTYQADLLEDPAVLDALDDRMEKYIAELTTELVSALNTFTPSLTDSFNSPDRMLSKFLSKTPDLSKRIAPHPSVRVDSQVENAIEQKFESWLVDLLEDRFKNSSLPAGHLSGDATDLFTRFLNTDPDLSRKTATFPQVMDAPKVKTAIDTHFAAYKSAIVSRLVAAFKKWPKPTTLAPGLSTLDGVKDAFFADTPELDFRRFDGLASIMSTFEAGVLVNNPPPDSTVSKELNFIAIINLFQIWEPTPAEADATKTVTAKKTEIEKQFFANVTREVLDSTGIVTRVKADQNYIDRLAVLATLFDTKIVTMVSDIVVEAYELSPLPSGTVSRNAEALFNVFLAGNDDLKSKVDENELVMKNADVTLTIQDRFSDYRNAIFTRLEVAFNSWTGKPREKDQEGLTTVLEVKTAFFDDAAHSELDIRSMSEMVGVLRKFDDHIARFIAELPESS